MADIHGSPGDAPQMPAASGPGPAPVPYGGGDPTPTMSAPETVVFGSAGDDVMAGVAGGNAVQESSYAHDVNAGLVTPYYPGSLSPIYVGGDADAGGRDDVAGTVAGAVAAAEARFAEHQSDAVNTGSGVIGDLMTIPPNSMDPAVGALGPEGGYYDPPRNY